MTLEFADPVLTGGSTARRPDLYFSAHYLSVMRVCMRQLGDHNDAEDATQEVFRRAIQQGIGEVEDPLPWLLTVARNVCVNELRRRQTGRAAVLRHEVAVRTAERTRTDDATGNPEPMVVGRLFVGELLGRLTPAERRAVAGQIIHGQSGGELAESMGVKASTARVLLARAKEKLRRYLEDGQGLLSGLAFGGWRAAQAVRLRVLGRPWALQGRAEMLLPVIAVTAIAGAIGGGGVAPPRHSGAAPTSTRHLAADHGDGTTAMTLAASNQSPAGSIAATLPDAPLPGNRAAPVAPLAPVPAGTQSPLSSLFPTPDAHQATVSDFEPSPNYQNDHTLFMVSNGHCLAWCIQLFRSSDGGATWTYLPSDDLRSTRLLIPPGSQSLDHFYATGGNMLQATDDGGASFHDLFPLAGITTVAPAWLGTHLVEADVALSFIGSSHVPHLAAAFAPSEMASSAPLLMPTSAGFTALEVVQNTVLGGPPTLLSCTAAGCTAAGQLPLTGPMQLIASSHYDVDHTLVAVGSGVAVSHDGGASFRPVSGATLSEASVVPGPHGDRLVAVEGVPSRPETTLAYSDDLGTTWQPASFDPGANAGTYARSPRLLRAGRLIAWAADASHTGLDVFVCSADGTRWSACTPDQG